MENNLKEKYFDTTRLLQNAKEQMQSLKDDQNNIDEQFKNIDLKSKECKDLIIITNENKKQQEKNNILNDILINNLLSIQQDLLIIALDHFKEHYKNKRLGEKTKEKYQDEIKDLINKNYNIDANCYLTQKTTYDNTTEYEISIYFKDYYYSNILKNEKIIYNITTDKHYLYYYNNIEYIDIAEKENYADYIYMNLTESEKELKMLEKELNDKIDNYNKFCIGALNYKRYNHIYLNQR